ncbi:hypothetical protein C8Q78DRAFT_203190 [Trametes maxima]|nr:hypothetical protein C8Q78DRAFT_203190 [Trametes maxima]
MHFPQMRSSALGWLFTPDPNKSDGGHLVTHVRFTGNCPVSPRRSTYRGGPAGPPLSSEPLASPPSRRARKPISTALPAAHEPNLSSYTCPSTHAAMSTYVDYAIQGAVPNIAAALYIGASYGFAMDIGDTLGDRPLRRKAAAIEDNKIISPARKRSRVEHENIEKFNTTLAEAFPAKKRIHPQGKAARMRKRFPKFVRNRPLTLDNTDAFPHLPFTSAPMPPAEASTSDTEHDAITSAPGLGRRVPQPFEPSIFVPNVNMSRDAGAASPQASLEGEYEQLVCAQEHSPSFDEPSHIEVAIEEVSTGNIEHLQHSKDVQHGHSQLPSSGTAEGFLQTLFGELSEIFGDNSMFPAGEEVVELQPEVQSNAIPLEYEDVFGPVISPPEQVSKQEVETDLSNAVEEVDDLFDSVGHATISTDDFSVEASPMWVFRESCILPDTQEEDAVVVVVAHEEEVLESGIVSATSDPRMDSLVSLLDKWSYSDAPLRLPAFPQSGSAMSCDTDDTDDAMDEDAPPLLLLTLPRPDSPMLCDDPDYVMGGSTLTHAASLVDIEMPCDLPPAASLCDIEMACGSASAASLVDITMAYDLSPTSSLVDITMACDVSPAPSLVDVEMVYPSTPPPTNIEMVCPSTPPPTNVAHLLQGNNLHISAPPSPVGSTTDLLRRLDADAPRPVLVATDADDSDAPAPLGSPRSPLFTPEPDADAFWGSPLLSAAAPLAQTPRSCIPASDGEAFDEILATLASTSAAAYLAEDGWMPANNLSAFGIWREQEDFESTDDLF